MIKSRQPSTLSRTSSRQSSVNLLDRRASSTSANKPRPATSFISTRVSQSSNPNIAVDDKLQLSVHQLGKLPAYLRNRRPASAIGKLERSESSTSRKLDKPKEEPFRFSPVYAVAKDLLEGPGKVSAKPYKEPDANLDDSGIQLCGPPCEGQGSGDAALQEAVLLARDLDLKELVGKTRQLSDACDRKQERIVQLEAEVAAQGRAVQERDEDIQKMKSAMNKIKSLSNNRDTVAREGLSELEQRLDGLQKELTLKCNDLNRFKDKNSKLKQKLAEAKATVEERDNRIFELLEKDAARVEEIKAIKELREELKQQLSTLQNELSAKDSLIADLRSQDPVKIAQTELEAYRVEVASLQQEVEQLRFENRTLISVKKQDDVILQIRTKLLENIERNRDAFRAQCERMCHSCIEGDREMLHLQ
ncbi:protein Hook homolog 3-like isoform X2 [Aedes aegypti]|uniref:Uncharacterized protein n=1 Tax=Aedes aegypti TaxID=7159 RepID=A0A6I8U7X6_AEDAE|nr:protein Hook homolog 3-like isoform X2 [Aedes aegypti]